VLFCDQDETIQHLFIECPLARFVWRIAYMEFCISPLKDIMNLLRNWFERELRKNKVQVRVGACVLIWAI
jgi:hypothetical protein